ncbi:thiol-disulfide isomerase/thioredoxin [Pedobacter sp. AK017]|uniref:TlpA family protein disulfide reductase n=1 Tax=Pedobacter sp. AK017 TaxID=2723073 RepID=UPI001608833B|nr:TlpA disulfide reductase family protein [Pedobacter sp. AK017]MBB5439511.1 thiol-disulfide isomerase/thioredoxin [Pedobacter sp. AK017]
MIKIIKLLAIFLSIHNNINAQSKGFELFGDIEGVKDGTTIYLVSREKDTLAIAKSANSKFKLNGYIKGSANFYFLKLDSNILNIHSNALWLVNSKLTLCGKLNDFGNLILRGSNAHDDWMDFKVLQDRTPPEQREAMKMKYINSHLNSLFTAYIIKTDLEESFDRLSNDSKNSYWGRVLKKRIDQAKVINIAQQLGRIPDFKIKSSDGQSISINSCASKYKYTLIDFWASWCGPCRTASPSLIKVYEAFESKGFNIVGVSIDESESAWKKAMSEDNVKWLNGIDNLQNAAKEIFGLVAVPGYLLINQEGKIIQSELISSIKVEQIRQFKDKNLSDNLYEIIEELLSDKQR